MIKIETTTLLSSRRSLSTIEDTQLIFQRILKQYEAISGDEYKARLPADIPTFTPAR